MAAAAAAARHRALSVVRPTRPQLSSVPVRVPRPRTARATRASCGGSSHHNSPATDQQLPRQPAAVWPAIAACAAAASAVSLLAPPLAHAAAAAAGSEGSLVSTALSWVLHLDKHLAALIQAHGPQPIYGLLWAIVFCETGLVVTPFLPGDSLLFAAGAFAGMGQLSLQVLFVVFMTSAVLGDAVNYAVGSKLGRWALDAKLIAASHVAKTEAFYAKYGGKTVVLARFIPIVRTLAPFIAGLGSMEYGRFAAFNVGGALLWIVLFLGAGYFFGNLPVVQHNFTLVVLGIVAVSVLPVLLELWQARKEAWGGGGSAAAGSGARA